MGSLMDAAKKKKKAASAPAPAPVAEELPVEATVVAPAAKAANAADAVIDAILKDGGADLVESFNNFGSKSEKLHLIATITDPSERDDTTIGGVKYTGGSIIGYRFVAQEDMSIPDFGTTPTFNGSRLNNAANTTTFVDVKAGTVFDLTKVETLALLSQEQFGMACVAVNDKGEQIPARCQVQFAKFNPSGELSADDLPSVSIGLPKGRSLKMELPHIKVLTYTQSEDGGRFASGTRVLEKEFEGTKFAPRALNPEQRKAQRRSIAAKKTDGSLARKRQAAAAQMLFNRIGK